MVVRFGEAESIMAPGSVLKGRRHGAEMTLEIEQSRRHKSAWLVFFKDVRGRDAAEMLRGTALFVDSSVLPPMEDGAYYHFELEGLEVVTESGDRLGRVDEVLETGANDVLSVRGARGEILIPVIDSVVQEIDREGGRIVITPLPGLIPEDA